MEGKVKLMKQEQKGDTALRKHLVANDNSCCLCTLNMALSFPEAQSKRETHLEA